MGTETADYRNDMMPENGTKLANYARLNVRWHHPEMKVVVGIELNVEKHLNTHFCQ